MRSIGLHDPSPLERREGRVLELRPTSFGVEATSPFGATLRQASARSSRKQLPLHSSEAHAGSASARKTAERKERPGIRREQRLVRVDPSTDAEGGAVEVRLLADFRERQRQRTDFFDGDRRGIPG